MLYSPKKIMINPRRYITPSKRDVSLLNQENSFQVRQPISSHYVVSKQTIQYTPSTDYIVSNNKQSESKRILNLLSNSKTSIHDHFQPGNFNIFEPVKQEVSSGQSIQDKPQKRKSKQNLQTSKNLRFEEPIKRQDKLLFEQRISQTEKREKRQSHSKPKKGLSLVKNCNNQKYNLKTQPILPSQINQVKQQEYYHFPSNQITYCSHFFVKIYNHYVQKGKISKLNFASILLHENLIGDLVKDRHLVQKIWRQICQLTENQSPQTLPMKIVFSFLASVLGYSFQEICFFEIQQELLKFEFEDNLNCAIKTFQHFQNRILEFRLRRLSIPKKLNAICSKKP